MHVPLMANYSEDISGVHVHSVHVLEDSMVFQTFPNRIHTIAVFSVRLQAMPLINAGIIVDSGKKSTLTKHPSKEKKHILSKKKHPFHKKRTFEAEKRHLVSIKIP